MKSQISPRDWELLSAYLDQQLKPDERAQLEARLRVDSEISAALGGLQRTRDALRSLPILRAPRNFTLTPQMAGIPSTHPVRRITSAFGFASALASFALILVLLGDLLGFFTPTLKPSNPKPAQVTEIARQAPTTVLQAEKGVAESALITPAPTQVAKNLVEQPLLLEPKNTEAIEPTPTSTPVTEAGFVSPTVEPSATMTESGVAVMWLDSARSLGVVPSTNAFSNGSLTLLLTCTVTTTLPASPATTAIPTPSATVAPLATALVVASPTSPATATPPAVSFLEGSPPPTVESPSAQQAAFTPFPSETQPGRSTPTTLRIMELVLAILAFGAGLIAILARRAASR